MLDDALKLQPTNPTFGDARDAVLLADQLLTGGENQGQIWTAFARRGMGEDASFGAGSNSLVVSNGFRQPSAFDDRVKVIGTPTAIDVLHNDFNLQGIDARTVQIVAQPLGGTATVGADGKITYTPSSTNFQPFDQIAYTYKNLLGGTSNTAVVHIVNQRAPLAAADAAIIAAGSAATINLLANDTDVENDINPASVTIVTPPKHGTVVVDQAGSATYTPNGGYFGLDSFQYTVKDANGNTSNIATVSIRVLIPNTPPTATEDVAQTVGTLPVVIDVLANDTDAEGRVVMCELLAEADAESPDLLIDVATLTVGARQALGTDVGAFFATRDETAAGFHQAASRAADPMWRLPLHAPYRKRIDSDMADIVNIATNNPPGAIIAALFLADFVAKDRDWLHLDVFGWNEAARPGRPAGGEATGMRALVAYLDDRYGSART